MADQPTNGKSSQKTGESAKIEYEEAVKAIENRYTPIFDRSFDCVFVYDLEKKFIYGNKAMMDLTGYTKEDMPRLDFFTFLSPDQMPEALESLQLILKDGFDERLRNYRIKTKSGEEKVIETRGSLIFHEGKPFAVQGIARDITERIRAEQKLKASKERYRNILDSIEDGYYEVDIAGNLTFYSDVYVKLTGYSRAELLGKNNREYMDRETAKAAYKIFNQVFRTKMPVKGFGYEMILKNGKKLPVEVSVSLIEDSDGNIVGFRGILRDVTERKALEEKLRQSEKMESIGTLTGGIAHDFNNILSVILGNTELALDCMPGGNPSREYLIESIAACLRAKELIIRLLSFSKKSEREQKPVNPAPVVIKTLNLLRSTVPANIEIRKHITDGHMIKADPNQMAQIITHLISNAQHAMEKNGGTIEVCLEKIAISRPETAMIMDLKPGDYIRLSVKDAGSGIDPKDFGRIFDPYYSTKDVDKGSGMGLAVVHGIVKSHGGSILLESRIGGGTQISIYFPALDLAIAECKTPDL